MSKVLKCSVCGKELKGRQKKYCSVKCRNQENKKKEDPQFKTLLDVTILSQQTNLTLIKSINELSRRMDRFVSMFEDAAKNVGDIKAVTRDEVEDIAKRIQEVVQQNKDLAEGLINLDSYVRRRNVLPPR